LDRDVRARMGGFRWLLKDVALMRTYDTLQTYREFKVVGTAERVKADDMTKKEKLWLGTAVVGSVAACIVAVLTASTVAAGREAAEPIDDPQAAVLHAPAGAVEGARPEAQGKGRVIDYASVYSLAGFAQMGKVRYGLVNGTVATAGDVVPPGAVMREVGRDYVILQAGTNRIVLSRIVRGDKGEKQHEASHSW